VTICNNIYLWNKRKKLLPPALKFDLRRETSFIIEELIEMNNGVSSEEARDIAIKITNDIVNTQYKPKEKEIVDAAADIIIYTVGLISKLGYDCNIVMDEVLKELLDREGELDKSGKWVKYQKKYYKANLSKARRMD